MSAFIPKQSVADMVCVSMWVCGCF